jgi:hypothetical protein
MQLESDQEGSERTAFTAPAAPDNIYSPTPQREESEWDAIRSTITPVLGKSSERQRMEEVLEAEDEEEEEEEEESSESERALEWHRLRTAIWKAEVELTEEMKHTEVRLCVEIRNAEKRIRDAIQKAQQN